MPGDLKLQFGIDVTGADRFSQTIRTITQDLNNIPKSVQGGLKDLNSAFKNISTEVGSLNKALESMGDDKGPMAESLRRLKTRHIDTMTDSLQKMRGEFSRLHEESKTWSKQADIARERGWTKSARAWGAKSASSADAAGLIAMTLAENKGHDFEDAGEAFGKGLSKSGGGGMGGGLMQMLSPMLGGSGMVGALMRGAPWLAAGMLGSQIYQNTVGLAGVQRETIAQQYQTASGREIALQHDPLRALLKQQGIGPEGEVYGFLRGLNQGDFGDHPIKNTLRLGAGYVAGEFARVVTGGGQQAFNAGMSQYLMGLSQASKARFGNIEDVISMRNQSAQQMFVPESMMGKNAARTALAGLAGQGLDPETAMRVMNMQAAFGMTPGTGMAAELGLVREHFGAGENMQRMLALRMARGGQNVFDRMRGGTSPSNDLSRLLGGAGLGPENTAARTALSEVAAQLLGQQDYMGGQDVSQALTGLSGAVRGAGEAGAPGEMAVGIGAQAFSRFQQGARTPFNPVNSVLMASLMGAGLSRMAATTLIQANVLTNENTQISGAKALGMTGPEGLKKFKDMILGPQANLQQSMVGNVMRQMTPQEQAGLGRGAAGVLLTGVQDLEKGQDILAATEGIFRAPPTGTAAGAAGAPTTVSDLRKEAASYAEALVKALKEIDGLLPKDARDAILTLNANVAQIVQKEKGAVTVYPGPITVPGAPAAGAGTTGGGKSGGENQY